jgi:peptidoglycan/LPS O-acetylase OafA/YrhL
MLEKATGTMGRYNYIDSLRGFAAISVIIYHIIEFTPPRNDLERILRSLLFDQVDLGKIAVTVFFAVSGFVIPFSLLRRSRSPLRDFAISRFFRLYPAYWLSILGSLLILYILGNAAIPVKATLINVTMLQQFFGVQNLIGVYWTLQIELIFYWICAGLFALGWFENPTRIVCMIWLLLALALILGIIRFASHKNLPVALPLALSIMFSGYLWRRLIIMSETTLRPKLKSLLFGYITLLPITSYFSYDNDCLNYTLTYYFAIAIFLLGTSTFRINSPIPAYLGQISYSLYLFGSLATVLCSRVLGHWFGYVDPLWLSLTTVAISVTGCSFIYRFIEAPSIQFGRYMTKQLAQK